MKKKIIAIAVTCSVLAGSAFLYSQLSKEPPSFEAAKQTMEGRWIFNSDYCAARLPADGLIELRLEAAGIKSNGVLAKGVWSSANDNTQLREQFEAALDSMAKDCQTELPSDEFALMKFESFEQQYHFAYTPGARLMMLQREGVIIVGSVYDELAIRNLADPEN